MPEQPGAGRLDPEILAAYIDGLLPPEERARVEAEIAADPETYEWLVNSINAVDDSTIVQAEESDRGGGLTPAPLPDPGPRPGPKGGSGGDGKVLPFYRGRTVQGLVGAVLAVAAALVLVVRTQPVWWQGIWGPSVDPRFAKLVEAVGEERYIEARLTGGFKYGPLREVMRGPGDLSSQNLQLLAAAGELQKAAAVEGSARNLHALGVALVLLGEYRQGVDALQRADALKPDDPGVLSDLAAALVARAGQASGEGSLAASAEDWPRALEAAERSLAIRPGAPEPAFNRALALEALGLSDQAASAWRAYLALDSTTRWAEDARLRLATLTERSRDRSESFRGADEQHVPPWRLRQIVETDVLATWAERAMDRSKPLELPPRLQQLAVERSDARVVVAVAHAAQTACAESQERCRRFAASHAGYARAVTLQGQELYGASLAPAVKAVGELDAVDSPLRYSARLVAARAQLRYGAAAAARQRLAEIVDAAPAEDPVTHAGALAQLGILEFSAGQLHGVEPLYQGQLRMAELSQDPAAIVVAHAMLGTFSRYVGDLRSAWSHWVAAAHYAELADARSRHAWLMAMGNACVISEFSHAASQVAEAAVANAREVHPAALVETGSLRAKAFAMLRMASAAEDAIQAGRNALDLITDPAFRKRLELQLLTTAADAPSGDYQAAQAAALRAITIVREQGERLRLPQLFLALSRALAALGDDQGSARALAEGLQAFERERGFLNTDQRVSYFDASWSLFSDWTERALEAGNIDDALDAFAKSRARTLDEARHAPGVKLTHKALTDALAPGEAVVLIAQFPHRVALTFVTSAGHAVHWIDLDQLAAQRLARRLEAGPEVERAAAEEAFECLLGPVRHELTGVDSLWIVPDVPYYGFPFAALLDQRSGLHLIEMASVAVAPNVDTVLRRRRWTTRPSVLLAVGVGLSSEGLPSLPASPREAETIAALYADSILLLNDDATPARIMEGARTADVAHFGAHAIANEERPMLSRLAVRDGSGRAASLFGRDLAQAKLRSLRVAVLAACGTGIGAVRRGEGPLSLARALIVGGAGTVIATLTDIPDETSLRLSVAVHRELASGARPMDALRAAQLELISQGATTGAWARTIVIGEGV